MAMVVKNNMSAVSTLNTLNKNSSALQKSLSKVSSGMKINSAQDDASGYAISERMRVQIRSLDQANQNTQNGSSLMKTAEGAVSSTVEILKSLKEKAINAANDTNKDSDRATIQKEIDQFIDQIDDNALTTFNGKYLVDGSKNFVGDATKTAFTNQSLAKDTAANDKLTALHNRNNESLEISSTDKVTASYVKDGKTFSTTYQVSDTTLEDIFKNLNSIDKQVFGGANLEKLDTSNTTAWAQATIASNAGTTKALLAAAVGSPINDGSNATVTPSSDYKKAAQVLMENGLIGSDQAVKDVSYATKDLNAAVDDYFASMTVENTDTSTAQTLTLKFAGFNSDGTVGVKSFDFSVEKAAVAGTKLSDVDSGTYKEMVAAFKDSIQNLAKAGTASGMYGDSTAVSFVEGLGGAATNGKEIITINTNTKLDAKNGNFKAAIDEGTKIDFSGNAALKLSIGGTSAGTTAAAGATVVAATQFSAVAAAVSTNSGADSIDNFATAFLTSKLTGLVSADSDIGLATSADMVSTADSENGLTVTAAGSGVNGQIAGVNISITDSEGNVKKAANAALDKFGETIRAQNKSDDNALSFQVGAEANVAIKVGMTDMRSEALGLKGSDGQKLSVSTRTFANAAVNVIDNAIQKAVDQQTTIGSIEARLAYTSENLTVSSENTQAAESTIRDADMAKEMTNYTKNNVLLQAAQSMLAQANQSSSAVLSLLQ